MAHVAVSTPCIWEQHGLPDTRRSCLGGSISKKTTQAEAAKKNNFKTPAAKALNPYADEHFYDIT